MPYRGEVKGGVVILPPGVRLAEGTVVSIQTVPCNLPNLRQAEEDA